MHGNRDRLGAAMLVGALLGFVIGALAGLSSASLASPVVLPFAGAAAGVLVAGVIGMVAGAGRGRREALERAMVHRRLRDEAHLGWEEGIDLTADAPPRPAERRPYNEY